jgi:predicted PurR-regulated permease PerM
MTIPARRHPIEWKWPFMLLAVLAAVAAITYLQAIFIPVAFSLLVYLLLEPLVRPFSHRPLLRTAASLAIVTTLMAGVVTAVGTLAAPVTEWIRELPADLREVEQELAAVRQPLREARESAKIIESLSEIEDVGEEGPMQVEVRKPTWLDVAMTEAPLALAGLVLALFFSLLLLARGDQLFTGLVQAPRTAPARRRLRVTLVRMQRELSRTLRWLLIINLGLGIVVAGAMWLWGLSNPIVWGLVAAVANFIPYVGAMVVTVLIWISSVVEMDSLTAALGPSLTFLAVTSLEGQFATPTLLGQGFRVNPFLVLLGIALLGVLWGIPGAFLAVPILVALRVLVDVDPDLRRYSDLLG